MFKNSHRKDGLPEVIHLHTSSISFEVFEDFFHELSLPPFCLGAPQEYSGHAYRHC